MSAGRIVLPAILTSSARSLPNAPSPWSPASQSLSPSLARPCYLRLSLCILDTSFLGRDSGLFGGRLLLALLAAWLPLRGILLSWGTGSSCGRLAAVAAASP